MSLQAFPFDYRAPAQESDLTTQCPVSETDLLNTSDCQPEHHVKDTSGGGDPKNARAKEKTTLEGGPFTLPSNFRETSETCLKLSISHQECLHSRFIYLFIFL